MTDNNHLPRISRWLPLICLIFAGCAQQFAVPDDARRDTEVALLFRREYSGAVKPGNRYMHLDIMPRPGEIAGFYSTHPGAFSNVLWGSDGVVYSGEMLRARRGQYVDVNIAKHFREDTRTDLRIVTDWVRIRVTQEQQTALARAVERMESKRPFFHLMGYNCNSRAAQCLKEAGIIPGGIPFTDNGENLLKYLKRFYPDLTVETGFFGLDAAGKPFMESVD